MLILHLIISTTHLLSYLKNISLLLGSFSFQPLSFWSSFSGPAFSSPVKLKWSFNSGPAFSGPAFSGPAISGPEFSSI